MRHLNFILLMLPLLLLAGCVSGGSEIPGMVAIPVTISDGGISVGVSDVEIKNLRESASIEVVYEITNQTEDGISPSVYLNFKVTPSNYDKAKDYEVCPESVNKWIKIHNTPEIKAGNIGYCTVVITTPQKFTEKLPDKYAFRIGVSGRSGGFFQTAVETWVLVSMR